MSSILSYKCDQGIGSTLCDFALLCSLPSPPANVPCLPGHPLACTSSRRRLYADLPGVLSAGRIIGDRGIMIILGSPCDWHSGETEVRLITLTSLLYQPRKHSEVPSHPNRERTQPVLPMFPDSCLAFLPSTWQLIVFPQDSAGQSCLRFHLASKHAGIYYFHWLQSNGNSTLPTNPKKLDFVIIER